MYVHVCVRDCVYAYVCMYVCCLAYIVFSIRFIVHENL